MKNSDCTPSSPPEMLSYQSKVKNRDEQLMTDQLCLKCGGGMERGFILDYTDGHVMQSTWMEGTPRRSFWTGVKIKWRRKFHIDTLRCEKCGYLESYAADEA